MRVIDLFNMLGSLHFLTKRNSINKECISKMNKQKYLPVVMLKWQECNPSV